MFKTVRKNAFRKNSKVKGGSCFNKENVLLILIKL